MDIPLSKLEDLVNGKITLAELVAASNTTIDDTILANAKVALALLSSNKHLINLALSYLNLPITFTSVADTDTPTVPEPVAGLDDLKVVLMSCPNCDDGDCGE